MTKYRQILLRKEKVPEAVCRQNKKKRILCSLIFFWKLLLSSYNMETCLQQIRKSWYHNKDHALCMQFKLKKETHTQYM